MRCEFCNQELRDGAVLCDWCGRKQSPRGEEPLPERRLEVRDHLPVTAANDALVIPGAESADTTLREFRSRRERARPTRVLYVVAGLVTLLSVFDLIFAAPALLAPPRHAPGTTVSYDDGNDAAEVRVFLDVLGALTIIGLARWRDLRAREGLKWCMLAVAVYDILCLALRIESAPPAALAIMRAALCAWVFVAAWRMTAQLSVLTLDSEGQVDADFNPWTE